MLKFCYNAIQQCHNVIWTRGMKQEKYSLKENSIIVVVVVIHRYKLVTGKLYCGLIPKFGINIYIQ